MNILEKSLGNYYPKLGSEIFADGNKTVVTVSRTLSPDHVDLDAPIICTDNESEETQADA